MTFDSQEHKDLVLALIAQANFPGKILEMATALKKAAEGATVDGPSQETPRDKG